MLQRTVHEQIGHFIVMFQHAEAELTELLVLMTHANDEFIRILTNELEYSKRVSTTDVMFARFIDQRGRKEETEKSEFHKLMGEFLRLGERRNAIVHSRYTNWINVDGRVGLVRENSKLRAGKGMRDIEEEDLLPEAFEADFKRLSLAMESLELFRLKIIDWLYPN